MSVLLFQSTRPGPRPSWLTLCLESAQALAQQRGWDYQLSGDELFEPLPTWFIKKVGERTPILSDLGRLLAAREHLKQYERVVWLDADVLIFAPEQFTLPRGPFGFGRERWVQPKGRGWKIHRSVCNALCTFTRGDPFLDFYIYTCQSVIRRADPDYIAPQMIGPKLLTALHHIADLPFTECIGSASPDLLIDITTGEGEALRAYTRDFEQTQQADGVNFEAGLNLCHSLVGVETYRGEVLSERALFDASQILTRQGGLHAHHKR